MSFILLTDSYEKRTKVIVNIDQIKLVAPCNNGNTMVQLLDGDSFIVEDKVPDICRRLDEFERTISLGRMKKHVPQLAKNIEESYLESFGCATISESAERTIGAWLEDLSEVMS